MLARTLSRHTWALIAGLAVLSASCSFEPSAQDVAVSLVAVEAPGGGGAPPKVNSTDPVSSPADVTLSVRVLGSGFDAQSVTEFLLAGTSVPDVTVNSTAYVSDSELVANLTIGGTAVEALYDVAVTNGRGKRGVGIELFEIGTLDSNGWDAVITEFRDGADRIRSDFDAGSGSRSYQTITKRQAIESQVTTDGRQWLKLEEPSGREVCVDFPAAGPDAQILSASDWSDLVAQSGGEVGLGQRWCGITTMHSRDHSDPDKIFGLDFATGERHPDVGRQARDQGVRHPEGQLAVENPLRRQPHGRQRWG